MTEKRERRMRRSRELFNLLAHRAATARIVPGDATSFVVPCDGMIGDLHVTVPPGAPNVEASLLCEGQPFVLPGHVRAGSLIQVVIRGAPTEAIALTASVAASFTPG
jgi:hypothetical protein